jgi:hypothetical protein
MLARIAGATAVEPKIIYGDDDRQEVADITDPGVRMASNAVALIVDHANLTGCSPDGTRCTLLTEPYDHPLDPLCPDEPFRDQSTAGFCTGFLVAPDLMATAGHCIAAETCAATAFVFGFAIRDANAVATTVDLETFHCTNVTARVLDPVTGADFAVVRLDRPAEGRSPLAVRTSGTVAVDTLVLALGYPSTLPLKVVAGARVRALDSTFFEVDLDTYGGNSGSPVIAADSLDVVGIVVRGNADFVFDQGAECRRSNRCDQDGCAGSFEQATYAHLLGPSLATIPVPTDDHCSPDAVLPCGVDVAACRGDVLPPRFLRRVRRARLALVRGMPARAGAFLERAAMTVRLAGIQGRLGYVCALRLAAAVQESESRLSRPSPPPV